MAKAIIKWQNKFSNEEGYVAAISIKEKHFVNTYNKEEAKVYANPVSAVNKLTAMGEAENNLFTIEPVE